MTELIGWEPFQKTPPLTWPIMYIEMKPNFSVYNCPVKFPEIHARYISYRHVPYHTHGSSYTKCQLCSLKKIYYWLKFSENQHACQR